MVLNVDRMNQVKNVVDLLATININFSQKQFPTQNNGYSQNPLPCSVIYIHACINSPISHAVDYPSVQDMVETV